MLLFKFKSYKNCFDLKNAEMLFIYENKNHVIDLKLDKKLLYSFFYALLKKELQILQNYLLKNLILNCIREFFSFAETSILFVYKENDNLRLCINYQNLNIIIIKNKCFFFFD